MSEKMTIRKIACLLLLGLTGISLRAQTGRESIEIDYGNPKTYVVGGVGVEGNQYFGENQVLQLTGLRAGMTLTVPGEDVTGIVKRLVAQRFFEDVAMVVDSLNVAQDTAWFKIIVKERPRVSRWTYSGVKSGERKDLQERLNLRPGREFSDYVQRTSEDIMNSLTSSLAPLASNQSWKLTWWNAPTKRATALCFAPTAYMAPCPKPNCCNVLPTTTILVKWLTALPHTLTALAETGAGSTTTLPSPSSKHKPNQH